MPKDAYGGENGMVGYQGETFDPAAYKKETRRSAAKDGLVAAGKGAAMGASIGSTIFPPIGTAVGAAIGAVGGAIFGGVRAKRKAKRERKKQEAWDKAQKQLAEERYGARKQAHETVKLAFGPLAAKLKRVTGTDMDLENKTPWGDVSTGYGTGVGAEPTNAPAPNAKPSGKPDKAATASKGGGKKYPNPEPAAKGTNTKKPQVK